MTAKCSVCSGWGRGAAVKDSLGPLVKSEYGCGLGNSTASVFISQYGHVRESPCSWAYLGAKGHVCNLTLKWFSIQIGRWVERARKSKYGKMLETGESKSRIYWSLDYSCNFSVNLKSFPDKIV